VSRAQREWSGGKLAKWEQRVEREATEWEQSGERVPQNRLEW